MVGEMCYNGGELHLWRAKNAHYFELLPIKPKNNQ